MAGMTIKQLVNGAAKAVVAPLKLAFPEVMIGLEGSLKPVKMVMDAAEAECLQTVLLTRDLIEQRLEQAKSMDDVEFPYEKVLHEQ